MSLDNDVEEGVEKIKGMYREQQEERLRKLINSEKTAALNVMAAGIAHDFNVFLTPVVAATDLAKMQAQKKDCEGVLESLDIIDDAAQSLVELSNSLLSVAKRAEYTRATLYINDILQDVVKVCGPQYISEKIELKTDLQEVPAIDGYRTGLTCVFMNFLTNAMQAYKGIPKEQPRTVYVRSYHKDGHICIEFEDNGKGINKEDLLHIFDEYFTTKKQGTGMGLFTAKTVIKESHRGQIKVESKYGQGTKFTVMIPDAQTVQLMLADTFFGQSRETTSEK
jgi:signal transduction histidine kinase